MANKKNVQSMTPVIYRYIEPKILGEINGQWVVLMSRNNGRCRFLRYNGEVFYLNGYKNIEHLTLEEAVRIFKWDKVPNL